MEKEASVAAAQTIDQDQPSMAEEVTQDVQESVLEETPAQQRLSEDTPEEAPAQASHDPAVPEIVTADTEELVAAKPPSPVVEAPKSPLGSRLAKKTHMHGEEELEPLVGM